MDKFLNTIWGCAVHSRKMCTRSYEWLRLSNREVGAWHVLYINRRGVTSMFLYMDSWLE